MKYDAETRYAQWAREVRSEQAKIADAAKDNDAYTLTSMVNRLAYVEGRMKVANAAMKAEAHGASALTGAIVVVEDGAGDTSTSRVNDVRRAKFDGILAEFTELARSERF
jgi:hypothetical protein